MQTTTTPGPVARWQAPGTCGEFVQGAIEGRDFLVNCPIDLFSRATAHPGAPPGVWLRDGHSFGKIARAVALAAEAHGLDLHHELHVESPIPRGKGMASSTADICAALAALCRSCGTRLDRCGFARLLAAVEPSDCVHVPGIAHVNHLTGEVLDAFPAPVGLRVIVVDCGGEVDTLGFDRERARGVYRAHESEVAGALARLGRGLRRGESSDVAEAATESARLSQRILYKPQFDALLARAREAGALGVNCAHSGTVLGVLYRADPASRERLLRAVEAEFGADLRVVGDFAVIGGGCREC